MNRQRHHSILSAQLFYFVACRELPVSQPSLIRGAPDHPFLFFPLASSQVPAQAPHKWFLKLEQGSSGGPLPEGLPATPPHPVPAAPALAPLALASPRKCTSFPSSRSWWPLLALLRIHCSGIQNPERQTPKLHFELFHIGPAYHWFQSSLRLSTCYSLCLEYPSLPSPSGQLLLFLQDPACQCHLWEAFPDFLSRAWCPLSTFLNMLPGKPQDSGDSYILWPFLTPPNFLLKQAQTALLNKDNKQWK